MIQLRPFKDQDARSYHDVSNSSPDIKRYIPGVVKNNPKDTEDYVSCWAVADFVSEYVFVVEHIDSMKHTEFIGAIWATLDDSYNGLNVSYFLGKDFRGRGYMKTALKLLIEYYKKNTPFDCLIFDIEVSNKASRGLVLSLGGQHIGKPYIPLFDDFETFQIQL